MSAQTKSPKMSSSIDTSHLKVKFPYLDLNGNFTFKCEVSMEDDIFGLFTCALIVPPFVYFTNLTTNNKFYIR